MAGALPPNWEQVDDNSGGDVRADIKRGRPTPPNINPQLDDACMLPAGVLLEHTDAGGLVARASWGRAWSEGTAGDPNHALSGRWHHECWCWCRLELGR